MNANLITRLFSRAAISVRAKSPEILLVTGVVGFIGGAVMACRATLHYPEIMDEAEEHLKNIKKVKAKVEAGEIKPEKYTDKDYQKDLVIVYAQTAAKFIRLYGPAIAVGTASLYCIISGHKILRTRNVALVAAIKTLEEGFKAYRKRVIEEYGEEKDYMFKNGLRSEQVTEIEVDEDGKAKKVKKNKLVDDPNKHSMYARFFDESCSQWAKTPEYNFMFLRAQQNYWNDVLQVRKHVFLNEVYDSLGIPRSEAGAIVGWAITDDGDNFIDFGIFDGDKMKSRDFVNGYERTILLDFNVNGVIYDLL